MGAKQQGATDTQDRWLTIPRTLCFVFHGDDVLLMRRAPHKRIFPNQYNGLGGHIERNEDPYTGARREIKEESGLDVQQLRLCAVHNIDTGESSGIMLFIFTARSTSRDITVTSPEGSLHWIPLAQLDQYDLVEDLPVVLPHITSAQTPVPYFAHIAYDQDDQIIIKFAQQED